MGGNLLFGIIVFLASAIICVPIAKRLGLSSVLGYLIAGVLIGPYVLGFVGEEGQDIIHYAEFGVVMMLFLIGLEIEPKNFWKMRNTILGMGGMQVAGTMLVSYILFALLGYSWEVSLVISMAVALSSTAISLQTIKEKGQFDTAYGSSSFAILLFQDIVVIFMIGSLPLLATTVVNTADDGHGGNFLETLPVGFQTLAIILSVVLVVFSGRYLIVPVLRLVSKSRVRELLTAAALLIVVGIAFLMELVGLSPALGAFLGGVVLANSEFKHELESTLEPFKGLLLGLFFMAVGASINFIVIGENPVMIGVLLAVIVLLKAIILFIVGTVFKMQLDQRILLTVGLAQIGEFAFVLLSFAFQLHIIDQLQLDLMLVITALTMALTPILGVINERLLLPNIGTKESEKHNFDHIAKNQKIILVGFGHFGSGIVRFLRSYGVEATILDSDSNRVDLLRKMGFEVYYGDATRMDLLESAGIEDAHMLISSIPEFDVNEYIVRMVQKHYPHVKIIMRAKNRIEAHEFFNMGLDKVFRQSLDTSVRMASEVLHELGFRKYAVQRQAFSFIKYDEEGLRRLTNEDHDKKEFLFKVKEEIYNQEKLLQRDLKRGVVDDSHHWDSEHMRVVLGDVDVDEFFKKDNKETT